MTETEARIRCLELAAQLTARTDRYNSEGIVDMAGQLFAFVSDGPGGQAPSKQAARRQRTSGGNR